jgi:hypothetical protein
MHGFHEKAQSSQDAVAAFLFWHLDPAHSGIAEGHQTLD